MISAIFSLIGFLLKVAYHVILYVYAIVVWLSLLMSKPFRLLLDKIKDSLGRKLPVPERLNQRFSVFNGLVPFLLLMTALVFSALAFWISSRNWDPNDNYLTYMIYNTTLGSFLGFVSGDLEFTPATVVAIAFSGAILPLCMDAHNTEYEEAPIYIRIPCYAAYLIACSILATMLTGVFQSLGQWGYQTIVDLFQQTGGTFFAQAGKIIVMIPLCYVALLLCLITVRTYAECFVFGLVGMVGLIVVLLLLELIPEAYNTLKEILSVVIVVVMFFGLDIWQSRTMEKLYQEMEELKEGTSAL